MVISSAPMLGVQLWPQHVSWAEVATAAAQVDALGFDSLWTWDHFYPHVGAYSGPNFEAWTMQAALAALTQHARIGVLVSAASYRPPSLLAYQAVTLDHISGGRAALGLGAGWFAYEHERLGFDLGTVGERLNRLRESARIVRALLDGETVSIEGEFFQMRAARLETPPVQSSIPIVMGGGGEQVTLRIVAEVADIWNYYGPVDVLRHKSYVLDQHCEAAGRAPSAIKRSTALQVIIRDTPQAVRERQAAVYERHNVTEEGFRAEAGDPIAGTPEQVAAQIAPYLEIGFTEVILMGPAPYDFETFARMQEEVLPLLSLSSIPSIQEEPNT